MKLTRERLRELLDYNPRSGVFRWRAKSHPNSHVKIGAQAGRGSRTRYGRIMIDGVRYYTHLLVWFRVTGKWPDDELDHKDRNRGNNRWMNLRPATRKQNCENKGADGVDWMPDIGKWRARLMHNGESKYLGVFKSVRAARAARRKAARQHFTHAS